VRLYRLCMITDQQYMQRCINLALKGAGYVSPNPMVGAVLVHNNRIIGEGWHQHYGKAHAEVNCIASVNDADKALIAESTMYVSLEPCAHYGKTPPCADLIVANKIPKVVIGCSDSYAEVSGKGIAKLKNAGVEVVTGVLEEECRQLNKRFFCRQEKNRPYIILKWAESSNGCIAPPMGNRVMLSNAYSQKWVHKMRSEEDAILVGFQTALLDNPKLSNRFGKGKDPVRIIIDLEASLPEDLYIFDQSQPTIIFSFEEDKEVHNLKYIALDEDADLATQILHKLKDINSIIIEGGSRTLQLFIDTQLWDEAFVIKTNVMIDSGIEAPTIHSASFTGNFNLENDLIIHYQNEHSAKL
jgi:diaminohydroxyphosphoribosylaminopyrimidine deaminase / 5-amino-6-(5-phosphoribosylamino)uracil reductase